MENERTTRSKPFQSDPEVIIGILQDQLQGYGSEDIAREILQNADDAGARRLDFYIIAGRDPSAPHPLAREPGLLVYNDGPFEDENDEGVRKIIGGSKQRDYDKIGRFGLGLKSVFNICDAFFYYNHIPAGKRIKRIGCLLDPYYGLREEYGAAGKLELWEDIKATRANIWTRS